MGLRARLLKLLWLIPAIPGVWQLGLLLYTVARRWAFPYDLEWMEGGMLAHALRLSEGDSIYAPPSVDFVPYLYTPLYPTLLAGLGKVFGLGYKLGRAVSILSMAAVVALSIWAVLREAPRGWRALAAAAASTAVGFYAATYPFVDGWYDLVRGDSLFMALGLGGIVALRAWARLPRGWWHGRVAVAAALLALSFHCKQTGVLLVAAGGIALLFLNWRAVPTYVVVAGVIGGGGTLLLDKLTGGWFWIYIFRVHQQHDTNTERFFRSFELILAHFPALTILVVATLIAVAIFAIARGRLPRGGGGFLYWTWMYAAGTLIGALGWATQWAHFNAYIPAFVFGGLAAASAVVALAGCAEEIELPAPARAAIAAVVLLVLGHNLWVERWEPKPLIPTRENRAAGDKLIRRLAAVEGDVYVPAHPWYAVLAGKRPFVHRMGILDVGYRAPRKARKEPLPPRAQKVAGLEEALRSGRFGAVVMDDKCQPYEFPGLKQGYKLETRLPRDERPRVVSGASTTPTEIWVRK